MKACTKAARLPPASKVKMIHKIDTKFVESMCSDALQELGFIMKRGIGTLNFDDNFYYWIGLNSGLDSGSVRINPFVGVHSRDVMKTIAEVGGAKYKPLQSATFAVFLGELTPNTHQFIFSNESDARVEAKRLASAIKEFGFPFMHSICDYEGLLPLLKKRVPILGGYPQRYAATLYLHGDLPGGNEFVDSYLADTKNSEKDVVEDLRNLKTRFLDG